MTGVSALTASAVCFLIPVACFLVWRQAQRKILRQRKPRHEGGVSLFPQVAVSGLLLLAELEGAGDGDQVGIDIIKLISLPFDAK